MPTAVGVALLVLAIGALLVVAWRVWSNVHDVRSKLSTVSRQLDAVGGTDAPPGDDAAIDAERLAAALNAAGIGVVVVDIEGRVKLRNPPAERFAGARHADALAEEVIGELLDRARYGEQGRRELQLFGPPREVLLVQASPLLGSSGVLGAVAFVQDMSDARRVESVRRDFVANVSHELKTPIGALALLAETMAATPDPAVMSRLAERVQREADRLSSIIDDLLDLSLIEAQEAPSRETVPVEVLLAEAADQVEAQLAASGTPLLVHDVPRDLAFDCDRRQLVSAIRNLLDNAVKYSVGSPEPVELGAVVDGERIVVYVRDHGIGIPSRDLERIFERFYRVDKARSRATGGTGLGLSIVRHVAQAHGGDVTVESREGEGSTFRLRIPVTGRGAGQFSNPQHREAP